MTAEAQTAEKPDYDSPWKEALERFFPKFIALLLPAIHAEIYFVRANIMTSLTFDTHEFVKKLQAVGFTQEQAEVFAAEHRRIIDDSLVTKEHLDMRLRELEYRLVIKLGAMMMAAVISIAALVKFL